AYMENLNDSDEKIFKKQAEQARQYVRMSAAEKQTIKDRVLNMPNPEKTGSGSHDYAGLNGFSGLLNKLRELTAPKMLIPLAAVAVLAIGGPVTYSAQQSGPGDVLHAFELNIIEPVQYNLQLSPEAKMAYSLDRLAERLNEFKTVNP